MPVAVQTTEQPCSRQRCSNAGPSWRSSASPPATTQVPGPLLRLSAWLPRRKIAKPRWLQLQYKLRPSNGPTLETLASVAPSFGFLLLRGGHELSFAPKSHCQGDD